MAKFYAVKVGRTPGIYTSWDACKNEVDKYKGAIYKSFSTKQEANNFLVDQTPTFKEGGLIAYVDGSFNVKTGEYGYGCVLLEGQRVIKEIYGKGSNQEYVSMRNVSGEIIGSEVAISYAIDHGYDTIFIYYDYEGIEKWANGMWKTNKPGTIRYAEFVAQKKKQIDIGFVKVEAHTGDFYNERADQLAKQSVGIQTKKSST